MNLSLYKRGVKSQIIINFVMPDPDLPKGTGWHLLSNPVIPDLISSFFAHAATAEWNLQTLLQDISMQRVEIPCRSSGWRFEVRDDAHFELQHLYITKFNDIMSN